MTSLQDYRPTQQDGSYFTLVLQVVRNQKRGTFGAAVGSVTCMSNVMKIRSGFLEVHGRKDSSYAFSQMAAPFLLRNIHKIFFAYAKT